MAIAKTTDYDLELHIATATALMHNFRTYYTPDYHRRWLKDQTAVDVLERMKSDPDLLRAVLLDSMIFTLQFSFWPNAEKTEYRQCPIDYPQVEELAKSVDWKDLHARGLNLPVFNGPVSSELVELTSSDPCLITMVLLHRIDREEIVNHGISLLKDYQDSGGNDVEWPLLLLVLHAHMRGKFSEDSLIGWMQPASDLSTSGDRDIAWHLFDCEHSGHAFTSGDRISGFTCLESALSWNYSPWASSYFDYQIQQSGLKRSDLSWDEWLKILRICSSCAHRSNPWDGWILSFDLLGAGSDRGAAGPICERTYWAWRTGYVVAMGEHLREEIVRLLNQDDFNFDGLSIQEYKEFEELSFVLDLLISLGRENEWHLLREMYARMLIAAQRDADEGRQEDAWPDDYEQFGTSGFATYGPDSVYYWFLRIGYIDGMINRASSLHEHDDAAAYPGTLALRNPDAPLAVGEQLEEFGEMLDSFRDKLNGLAIMGQRNQDETISKIMESRNEVVTVMSDRLPPGAKELRQILQRRMGENWNVIPNTAKRHLIKAERLSRTGTDDDDAKVWFSKSVEAVLQKQLVGPLIQFMKNKRQNTAVVRFRGSRSVQEMSRKGLEKMSLSDWAGVFDTLNTANGTNWASLGTEYLKSFLSEQFGKGTVDKVAQLSWMLQEVQDLRNGSAHFHEDRECEGIEDLRDLITGNGDDALITRIIEVFPAKA